MTNKTKPKRITHDEMMDMYFVAPDKSVKAYHHAMMEDADEKIPYGDFYRLVFTTSSSDYTFSKFQEWGEALVEANVEHAKELACKDGYQVMTPTTKPKLITNDEMMDLYFVAPDTSLEAYYDANVTDKEEIPYDQFLFYYSSSMNGFSNANWDSWAEGVWDEAIEEARDLALRDGHQIIGDDLGFTDGYYIDPGKAESEILIVEDWNDFSTWIEFVIEELEKEEKRRQIWNEIRDRHSELEFKSDESEYNDEFEAMGEFAEAMKEMGDDTSTTFFDHFVLVDDEDNRTEYTAGELRDIAKRMGI